MSSESAACIRCGIRRYIHTRREHPLCAACAILEDCPPSEACALPPGRWRRRGLVWTYHPDLPDCGTHRAFNRHKAHREPPCLECYEAEREYQRERKRIQRQRRREEAA